MSEQIDTTLDLPAAEAVASCELPEGRWHGHFARGQARRLRKGASLSPRQRERLWGYAALYADLITNAEVRDEAQRRAALLAAA